MLGKTALTRSIGKLAAGLKSQLHQYAGSPMIVSYFKEKAK